MASSDNILVRLCNEEPVHHQLGPRNKSLGEGSGGAHEPVYSNILLEIFL